ncbi:MAG: uncharacterized protein A8A55_1203 [Amphiamblys sp. WSBS2006]|nr:MAG: uncharacterized protein A8A55_1203 [Amphiamblys sp. WSBS2006]
MAERVIEETVPRANRLGAPGTDVKKYIGALSTELRALSLKKERADAELSITLEEREKIVQGKRSVEEAMEKVLATIRGLSRAGPEIDSAVCSGTNLENIKNTHEIAKKIRAIVRL